MNTCHLQHHQIYHFKENNYNTYSGIGARASKLCNERVNGGGRRFFFMVVLTLSGLLDFNFQTFHQWNVS